MPDNENLLITMVSDLSGKVDRLTERIDEKYMPRLEAEQRWKNDDERYHAIKADVEGLKANRLPTWFAVVVLGIITIIAQVWGVTHQIQIQQPVQTSISQKAH